MSRLRPWAKRLLVLAADGVVVLVRAMEFPVCPGA
jgi:hypothetical protein